MAAEFTLAFLLVFGALVAIGGPHSPAHAVPLPTIDSRAILEGSGRAGLQNVALHHAGTFATARPDGRRIQEFLLGLALAGIAAFNFAFWRHLRRVYASPRRNVWRRG